MSDVRPFHSTLLNKISGNGTRWLTKKLSTSVLPWYFRKHPGIDCYRKSLQEGRTSDAIVSLTSFPKRIGVVWLVVECILRQTRVPKRIVVWLSKEQFSSVEELPKELRSYPEDVVQIRMVDRDIRSHKKYWYAVEEYKDSPIVLVDDDLVYDSHLIEDLEEHSSKDKKIIACCWGARLQWNEDGTVKDYSQWGGKKPELNEVTDDFCFGSGGGTYFPVGSLEGARQPIDDIMSVCPMADDIWLNAISRKNKFKTCLIRHQISVPEWNISGNETLEAVNNGQHQNDIQLQQVRDYFVKHFGEDPFSKF